MTDQMRIFMQLYNVGEFTDKELYVMFKAVGAVLNLILSPYNPRIEY